MNFLIQHHCERGPSQTGSATKEPTRVALAPGTGQDVAKLTADFLPERLGRYRAVASLPDGTTLESRFIVFTAEKNSDSFKVSPSTACAP